MLTLLFIFLYILSSNIMLHAEEMHSHQNIKIDLYNNYSLKENLSLSSTNTWYEFKINHEDLNEERWAWIASIIFKSKNALKLKKLCLKWDGNVLNTEKIGASLYQKKETEDLPLLLEKNLVCDGKWNKITQEIIFQLDEKLIAINKYYLVISFPQKIKQKIQTGRFALFENSFQINAIK